MSHTEALTTYELVGDAIDILNDGDVVLGGVVTIVTTKTAQGSRYWLTPEGCAAIDTHRPDLDGRHCRTCGVRIHTTQETR